MLSVDEVGPVWAFLLSAVALLAAVLLGKGLQLLVFRLVGRWLAVRRKGFDVDTLNPLRRPLQLLFPVIMAIVVVPFLTFPAHTYGILFQVITISLIICVAWVVTAVMQVLRDLSIPQYESASKEDVRARRLLTQFNVLQSIINVFVVIIATAAVLMTFETVRDVGTKILASAGVAGIIIGFAAQKSIATLIAGIQLAIAQPIRLDDVVVVEGEQGEVEEINLTYVVIKLYDLRRLIVPINYFIDKPFLNNTYHTLDLYGTVLLYLDHRTDVAALRKKALELVQQTEFWNQQYFTLMVTNTRDLTIEVRVRASAENPDRSFELHCYMREKLLEYLRNEQPDALPGSRIQQVAP